MEGRQAIAVPAIARVSDRPNVDQLRKCVTHSVNAARKEKNTRGKAWLREERQQLRPGAETLGGARLGASGPFVAIAWGGCGDE